MTQYLERLDWGDSRRVIGTFTDAAGAVADPDTVNFLYQTPAGVSTTLVYGTDAEVVKSSTGVYYVELTFNQQGEWTLRFESATSVIAADEETVYVRRSVFH